MAVLNNEELAEVRDRFREYLAANARAMAVRNELSAAEGEAGDLLGFLANRLYRFNASLIIDGHVLRVDRNGNLEINQAIRVS